MFVLYVGLCRLARAREMAIVTELELHKESRVIYQAGNSSNHRSRAAHAIHAYHAQTGEGLPVTPPVRRPYRSQTRVPRNRTPVVIAGPSRASRVRSTTGDKLIVVLEGRREAYALHAGCLCRLVVPLKSPLRYVRGLRCRERHQHVVIMACILSRHAGRGRAWSSRYSARRHPRCAAGPVVVVSPGRRQRVAYYSSNGYRCDTVALGSKILGKCVMHFFRQDIKARLT
ncbi:hypothetical protein C8Q70DRAFT_978497 [Cubamyces menziesii]|nr:hypothetical protein C8Q70DRAFT_978497 [Cubamyces menziesii]